MSSPISILVVRRETSFSQLLQQAGCSVTNVEMIATEPLDDLSELAARMAGLDQYHGLFFTSPAAAEVFVSRLDGARGAALPPVYVLGGRASEAMRDAGLDVRTSTQANTAEELINSFEAAEFAGKRFLFVRGERSLDTIPRLIERVATVDQLCVYRTLECTPDPATLATVTERLGSAEFDWVCFFSPSGVERAMALFGNVLNKRVQIAAIGASTAAAAEKLIGRQPEFVSASSSSEDFAKGLLEHIKHID